MEQSPEGFWDGVGDVVEWCFREFGFELFYEFIGEFFATGVTEVDFTGVGDEFILFRMVRALIFMIAEGLGITTVKHLFDGTDGIKGECVEMCEGIIFPVIF